MDVKVKKLLESRIPDHQKPNDVTVQMAKEITGYTSHNATTAWLNSIPELTRIRVLLNSGKIGFVWRMKA